MWIYNNLLKKHWQSFPLSLFYVLSPSSCPTINLSKENDLQTQGIRKESNFGQDKLTRTINWMSLLKVYKFEASAGTYHLLQSTTNYSTDKADMNCLFTSVILESPLFQCYIYKLIQVSYNLLLYMCILCFSSSYDQYMSWAAFQLCPTTP